MRIPEVRVELLDLATELDAWGLPHQAARVRYLVSEMVRRPCKRRAAPYVPHIPRSIIRRFADAHPRMPYMTIAVALGTNIGRVSEAVAGKRA
jgi:hypothetical protein